jgi:hypothetical protein
MPILVIDDEADQASINTRGNRDPGLRDDEVDDEENPPSRTNGLIRAIPAGRRWLPTLPSPLLRC